MRPALAPALAALALALAGCPGDEDPSGKADGEACAGGAECRSALCFQGTCAAALPAAASCPSLPGAPPEVVVGGAVEAIDPGNICVTPVRPAVGTPAFVDLGEAAVGSVLEFDVPPGTTSFTILSQAVPGTAAPVIVFEGTVIPNSVVPTDVLEPSGALFYSELEPLPMSGLYPDPSQALAYYGGWTPISGAFTVPNTSASLDRALSAGSLPAGRWRFTVNDYARLCRAVGPSCAVDPQLTGVYRVQLFTDARPFTSTGTLDLEVYLATDPTSRLATAAAAAQDPAFTRWVTSLGAYLAKAGVCLGTVTLHDLPAWARERYAPGGVVDVSGGGQGLPAFQTLPGCDDLSQLFTVGLAQSRAVHLFFADALTDETDGLTVLGVDGSIPGPSGAPGTVNGGAVVGLFDLLGAGTCTGTEPDLSRCGSDVLALVTAHEAGHWLGLYHTTEAPGIFFDPLSDTDTCACLDCVPFSQRRACAERGAANPTFVTNSSCSGRRPRCGGGQNLMFWLFDDRFATGELSRQQGDVVRRNPAVR